MAEKKSHRLSIYLIHKDVTTFSDVLIDVHKVEEYKLKGSLKLSGAIFVGQTKRNPAKWVQLLQQGTDKQIRELNNSSNRAVLLLKIEGRIFAIPFGFGKYLLREAAIETEFGLRTTLNIIDPDKLRSLNKANADDFTLLTTTQSSRSAKPQDLQIDIVRDMVRGVTGEPFADFNNLGATVTGNDGVNIIPAINFEDIESILRSVGKAYKSRRYKARFDWIDNIKPERDSATIEKLRNLLLKDIKSENKEVVHLSAPVIIDWENYEGFSFTRQGELTVDLSIDSFYEVKSSSLGNLTWDKLKAQRLFMQFADKADRVPVPLIRSLNYQTNLDGNFYALAFGQWYVVNKNFSKQTIEYVNTVKESTLNFIGCRPKWREAKYNTELSKSKPGYILFDKKLVRSDAYRSEIEVCDVFANQKEFVHVKFKGSSSTLSHLFAQGRISGNLLASDEIFRKNLRAKLKDLGGKQTVIPQKSESFVSSKYTITFAVIAKGKKSFVESLPFFSLLNFRLTATELRLLGFDVRVKKIDYS